MIALSSPGVPDRSSLSRERNTESASFGACISSFMFGRSQKRATSRALPVHRFALSDSPMSTIWSPIATPTRRSSSPRTVRSAASIKRRPDCSDTTAIKFWAGTLGCCSRRDLAIRMVRAFMPPRRSLNNSVFSAGWTRDQGEEARACGAPTVKRMMR